MTWTIYINFRSPFSLALIGQAVSEEKIFEIVNKDDFREIFEYYGNIHVYCPKLRADQPLKLWTDDDDDRQTPEHGHPINSPCEPLAQVS